MTDSDRDFLRNLNAIADDVPAPESVRSTVVYRYDRIIRRRRILTIGTAVAVVMVIAGATTLLANRAPATTDRPAPTAIGATAPSPTGPAPSPAASIAQTATGRPPATALDEQLLNAQWLIVSIEHRGAEPQDITGFLPVVVELTASFLAYDTDCGGTLNKYSTAAGAITIGAVVKADGHACVMGIAKGPGPEVADQLFTPGTVFDYHINGGKLTLQTSLVTLTLRRNGPIHLGIYYPELTRNPAFPTTSSTAR